MLTPCHALSHHQALRKTSRAVSYFPSIRAVVNQMTRNAQRRAALSTSSTDTALSGDGKGTFDKIVYCRCLSLMASMPDNDC